MNIDRGKESFDEAEVQALRDRTRELKGTRYSWDALGKLMGIPGGTLSTWVPGNYKGDNQRIARDAHRFFLAESARQDLELEAAVVPGFQPTETARKIHGQFRWAQRGKMVVATGESGVGKTSASEQYAAVTNNVFLATMSEGTTTPTSMLVEILRGMGVEGYRSGGMGGVQTLSYMVMERLDGRKALLILDESQYLSDRALNQLRFIHDKCEVGIALCGNADVMGRIRKGTRGASAPFAQLHSRISMPHHYAKPHPADVNMLLDAWKVEDKDQRTVLAGIAAQPGCLRNLSETLEAATLVARQSDEDLSLSHIQAAWKQRSGAATA